MNKERWSWVSIESGLLANRRIKNRRLDVGTISKLGRGDGRCDCWCWLRPPCSLWITVRCCITAVAGTRNGNDSCRLRRKATGWLKYRGKKCRWQSAATLHHRGLFTIRPAIGRPPVTFFMQGLQVKSSDSSVYVISNPKPGVVAIADSPSANSLGPSADSLSVSLLLTDFTSNLQSWPSNCAPNETPIISIYHRN